MHRFNVAYSTATALLLLAACGDTHKDAHPQEAVLAAHPERHGDVDCELVTADAVIEMRDVKFIPAVVSVPNNGVVRWTNDDSLIHNVSSGVPGGSDAGAQFDSGKLDPGESFCVELSGDLEIPYYCKICPEMRGSVIVGNPSH